MDELRDLLGIVLRASIMYLYMLALLRLTGKRDVGDLTPLDFITALMIGDLFDNVFWNTSPLSAGLVATGALILWQVVLAFLIYRFPTLAKILTGSEPVRVVTNGRFQRQGLDAQRTNEGEVYMELRDLGEEDLTEVKEASWEPSGHLSMFKKEPDRPVQKQDLPAFLELFK